MAILSLFLDRLKVGKLSKSKFVFLLYTENVNAVGDITYKDNEHLKCIVLHSLGIEKMVNDVVPANMWVSSGLAPPLVVTLVTGVERRSSWRDVRPVSIAAPSEGWRTLIIYTHDVCEY